MAKQLALVLLVGVCLGLELEVACGGRNKPLHSSSGVESQAPVPSAVDGTCKAIIETYGYLCQEYTVTTEDGYILSMQRIPEGRSERSKIAGNKQPVLLQHGLLMDGVTWMLNSPEQSLAYILADDGFDVWIANTRGTRWSQGHTSLQPNDPDYWNWSWDELVQYDLPSTFEFVHDQTGQKLHYIGHSLGTLIAFASFSQGKLLELLKSAVLLSPIAYLSHITTVIGRLGADAFLAEKIYWLGVAEFNPKGKVVGKLIDNLCHSPGVDCYDLMTLFTGKNCCLNSSTIDFFLKYEPQSTSTKNMIHLAQMIREGNIAMYDYGNDEENIKHYGQSQPPLYNMSNIPNDIPLYLSYGGEDALSDVEDVNILLHDHLKFHDEDKLIVRYVKKYAHADFVMAINAKKTIYEPIIAFFNKQ